jgi:hypothetical protein
MIARLVSKALRAWTAWRHAARVERRMPELASLRKAEAERRRNHRPVRDIHLTRRAIVHRRLADELGRTA